MVSRRKVITAGLMAPAMVATGALDAFNSPLEWLAVSLARPKNAALIINPENDSISVKGVYNFLAEHRYPKDNIELLYVSGQRAQWQLPNIPVNGNATRSGLEMACERLASKVNPKDTLFVYFQYHGDKDKDGEPRLALRYEGKNNWMVPVSEFAYYIGRVPAKRIVFVTSQCYGYDFGERLRQLLPDRQATVLSFARPGERAYASDLDLPGMFADLFQEPAMLKDLRNDRNKDGFVSLREAADAYNLTHVANKAIVNGPDFYFQR